MIDMIEEENSFLQAITRQKIETDLKRETNDLLEDRYDEIFTIKYTNTDHQVINYISMPFDYESELEKKEVDAGLLILKKLGIIPKDQVKILNDIDLQDTAQLVMYDEELGRVYSVTIKVQCTVPGSYYDEDKRMWILPLKTRKAGFIIEPVKNWEDSFDFSGYHEFSIKSMEKKTNYVMLNDEEGIKKIHLEKSKQEFSVNVVQDNWDQVIRVKLKPREDSVKWLTHYIAFKTK